MRKVALPVLFVASALISPARAQFCPGVSPWVFDDVLASDPFCGFVTWMAQNGITLGCQTLDSNHRLYCPAANVTRLQMAAFMNRLGNVRVEAVDTGPGLMGGPITGIGTIILAPTQLLPTVACANNQITRWNGSAWTCSSDANSGGTVTSVASGTGLAGGPITSSGTLSIAAGYQLPQGCASGQVAKSNGVGSWTCAGDSNSGGTVTSITAGNGLTGGTITTSGTVAVDPTSTTLTNNFYRQGGNAFGATAVLGTSDNNVLDIRVNGTRVVRYEPNPFGANIVGGHPNNTADSSHAGQTVAGGGTSGSTCYDAPTDSFARTCGNQATSGFATIAGGFANRSGAQGAIGGGQSNTTGILAVVGGGQANTASGDISMVPGGFLNVASGVASFAAGFRAKTQTAGATPTVHDGAFVFADYAVNFDFNTAASNEFAARATGGVRFVTAVTAGGVPTRTVRINPNGELDFGSQTRQVLNLWGPAAFGIGVQSETHYARSAGHFTWFRNGVHSDVQYDPGAGGEVLMSVSSTPVTGSGTTHTGTVRAAAFAVTSDRAAKQDFSEVDTADVLAKVVATPVLTWAYRNDPQTRHIGMTGQDFRAAFGVGDSEKAIATVDADGVALAAIQGLNAKLESANAKIDAQAREIAELRRAVERLLER